MSYEEKDTYLVPHAARIHEKMRAWPDHRQNVRRSEAPEEAFNDDPGGGLLAEAGRTRKVAVEDEGLDRCVRLYPHLRVCICNKRDCS